MGENFNKKTGGIAEVPSFSWGTMKKSRHCSTLTSTDIDIGYGTIFTIPFLLLATIPGVILGSIIKGLSFIKNTNAQKSHLFVKEILTPKDEIINLNKQKSSNEKKDAAHQTFTSNI